MEDFEKSQPAFQGSVHIKRAFGDAIADVFNTLVYKKLALSSPVQAQDEVDRTYTTNKTFWEESLNGRHFESMRINLRGFHLTEWIPSSPGRYYMPDAARNRRMANDFLSSDVREVYAPRGKDEMVLGGVGSLRLRAKTIESQFTHFLGASSTGVTHQGIPLAMPDSTYRAVIQVIKEHGGCYANVYGSLRVLSLNNFMIRYWRQIPRYCLFVDDIEVIRPSSRDELIATVAIMFPTSADISSDRDRLSLEGYDSSFKKLWSFCSFNPGMSNHLTRAVDWLNDYMQRYSNLADPPVLCDFDEHYSHFDNRIEFPLAQLSRGKFNMQRLDAYQARGDFAVQTRMLNTIDRATVVFISYRRADSAPSAGRIYDQLCPRFGRENIFRDVVAPVDKMPPGRDFRASFAKAIDESDVQLVLIGPQWATITNAAGQRRLDDPDDPVRQEIEIGLQRGIPVIPVLIDGTPMPTSEQLPASIAQLRTHHALSVRNGSDFDDDVCQLIHALHQVVTAQNK